MSFLNISPGVNIKCDQIVAIEDIDMMTCKILTTVGAYESIYPSWRILMLLDNLNQEEETSVQPETPSDKVNLWGRQYFAG